MDHRSNYSKARLVGAVSVLIIFAVVMWALVKIVGQPDRVPTEVSQFVQDAQVPYAPLLPTYLPVGAKLLTDAKHSFLNPESNMLTLRWVFPAQTLPGQGTLLLYQASEGVSFLMPVKADKTVFVRGAEATLGDLATSVDVPASPGRRALSFKMNNRQIVLVSYAISDQELLKVAESLK